MTRQESSGGRVSRFDVAVLGAGVAGLSCAIEAAESGATVALVDIAQSVGGTAGVAGGGTCIAGSPLQERLGIVDSADQALEDWIAWGGESVDVPWAERYLRAGHEIFGRLSQVGVEWTTAEPREGNRVPRWHKPAGGGAMVMRKLEQHARQLPGISWFLGHLAGGLTREGGHVVGLDLTCHGGHSISAQSTVVASGGFNNNYDMVREHAAGSGADRILLGGGVGARGAGHQMLQSVGAQFTQLDAVWMFPYGTPDHRHPDSNRGLAVRGVEGDLWINDNGDRFHNEALRSGATGTRALLAQPGGRCWSVIDRAIASRMTIADPYYRTQGQPIRERIEEFLETSPHVVSAPTLADLASAIGVDGANLRSAVGDINAAVAGGSREDPRFGKPLAEQSPVVEPPFYAIRFYPLARKNLGGVRTNMACQVLDEAGRVIEGLFAAGEVAGMAGGRINGRAALEGTSFGPSLFSGSVAGRQVAGSGAI